VSSKVHPSRLPGSTGAPQDVQSAEQVLTEACGFVTIVAGTFLLHSTKDMDVSLSDVNRVMLKEKDSSSVITGSHMRRGSLVEDTQLLLHSVEVDGQVASDDSPGHNHLNGRKMAGLTPKR
jgi:hypothetical protein